MNRKDWLKVAGLLGLGATGAGLAGAGPLAGLLGGVVPEAAAGAAGAVLPAGMAGPTTAGASGAMGLGNMVGQAMGPIGSALDATNKVGKAYGVAQAGAGLLGPQEQPMAPPPQPAPFQPTPVSSPYGMDQPPPGIDPRQWAMMSPEQKKMMMWRR